MKVVQVIIVAFCLSLISSCTSPSGKKSGQKDQEVESAIASDEALPEVMTLEQEASALAGMWTNEALLERIERTKSVYAGQDVIRGQWFFKLDKKGLLTGTATMHGGTPHEGGYDSKLFFDKTKQHFQCKKDFDGKAFDINLLTEETLEVRYTKSKKSIRYRKGDFDDQLRSILMEGEYGEEVYKNIKLTAKGRVSGFKNYKYYRIISDFSDGIDRDMVVFYDSKDEFRSKIRDFYYYVVTPKDIVLMKMDMDWESLDHELTDTTFLLIAH